MKYLLRLGEITLKSSRTRKKFLKILLQNIENTMLKKGIPFKNLHHEWSRIYLDSESQRIEEILSKTFGIHSFSPVQEIHFENKDEIIKKGKEFFSPFLSKKQTFAVRVKRKGKHPFNSRDIERELGNLLFPLTKGVHLDFPDITCFLEIREKKCYFFTDKKRGPGGLPANSQGKLLCLLSGGFDSAVSAWFGMKRGASLDFIFFNLGGTTHLKTAYKVARFLYEEWNFNSSPLFILIDLRPLVLEIKEKCKEKFWNIILKRVMFNLSDRIAKSSKYEGILSGCSIGQVSTQTLRNLNITVSGIETPVLRPLLGFDKEEIISISRKIGTYPLCASLKEYCGIVGEKPATSPELKEVIEEENKIDKEILEYLLNLRKEIPVSEHEEIVKESYEIEEVKNNFIIIDLRDEKFKVKGREIEQAMNIKFNEFFQKIEGLNKDKEYLLICEFGLKSEEAAEFARKLGYNVYNLAGGYRTYKKLKKIHSAC